MIKYTNFSFDFIPYPSLRFVGLIMNWFNLPVNEDLMTKVGLKSGSTFFNNISLLINILFVVFLHLMFLIIRRILCAWWKEKQWVKFVIDKIYKLLTLGLYLRLMLEAYQFLLIWSTDEIHSFKTSTNPEITSLAIAMLVFIFLIVFTVFVLVITIKQIPYLILRILKYPKYIKEQLRVQIILSLTLMRSLTERRIQNTPSFIRLCLSWERHSSLCFCYFYPTSTW